jgi:putative hydrolase of the HAD superfamily
MGDLRAAIFDIGGVLTTSPVTSIRRFCEREGLPHDVIGPMLATHDGAWSRFEKSEIPQEAFVEAFEAECAEKGVRLDGRGFLDAFFGRLEVREEMVGAVRLLRGQRRLGCITNNVARDDSRPRGLVNLDELFEVVVESAKVGLRKPDPAIYLYTCDLLSVQPQECVFLDDFGVNLKAARALGMITIRVDETLGALDELEQVLGLTLR